MQAMSERQQMEIAVNIAAPLIVIPEELDKSDKSNNSAMIIDFGTLEFNSMPAKDASYDSFALNLTNLQLLSTTARYDRATSAHFSPLIEPFSLSFDIGSLVNKSSADLPRFKVSAKLPLLSFNVTASVLRLIKRLEIKWEGRKETRRGTKRRKRGGRWVL